MNTLSPIWYTLDNNTNPSGFSHIYASYYTLSSWSDIFLVVYYNYTSLHRQSPYLEHATTRLVSTKTCPSLHAQTTSAHAIQTAHPVSQSEARTEPRFGKLPREHLMNKWPTWLGPCTTSYGGPSYTQPLRTANPVITVLDDRYIYNDWVKCSVFRKGLAFPTPTCLDLLKLNGNQGCVTVGEQTLQHMWHKSVKFFCMTTILFPKSSLRKEYPCFNNFETRSPSMKSSYFEQSRT